MKEEFNIQDLQKLNQFVDSLRGEELKSPILVVADQITDRLKINEPIDHICVNSFLTDLVGEVAKGKVGKSNEVLLKKIKKTESYGTASSDFQISDETIITFINEAKVRLAHELYAEKK